MSVTYQTILGLSSINAQYVNTDIFTTDNLTVTGSATFGSVTSITGSFSGNLSVSGTGTFGNIVDTSLSPNFLVGTDVNSALISVPVNDPLHNLQYAGSILSYTGTPGYNGVSISTLTNGELVYSVGTSLASFPVGPSGTALVSVNNTVPTWLGYTPTGGFSNIVSRDTNGNSTANNFISGCEVQVASGTITLTSADTGIQVFQSGTSATLIFPNANTLSTGQTYTIINHASGNITVEAHGGSSLFTIPAGGTTTFTLTSNLSSAGQWSWSSSAPENATWGTSDLNMTSTSIEVNSAQVNSLTTGRLVYSNTSDVLSSATVNDPLGNLAFASGVLSYTGTPGYNDITVSGTGTFGIVNAGTGIFTNISVTNPVSFSNIIDTGLTANELVYANGSKQLSSAVVNDPLGNLAFVSGSLNATGAPTYNALTLDSTNIALGLNAGQTSQGAFAIAVGNDAGQTSQGSLAVAAGYQAGQSSQGSLAVAIGYLSGQNNQTAGAVAIGYQSAVSGQGNSAVAIGANAAFANQSATAIAIGNTAGFTGQSANAIAMGSQAGYWVQGSNAVAIGTTAGFTGQAGGSIAIGVNSGEFNQAGSSIAMGNSAGNSGQGNVAVGIGYFAGNSGQGNASVAIGQSAGQISQSVQSIAIGQNCASSLQGVNSVAIGTSAGQYNQGTQSVAIGLTAGFTGQASNAVAIGTDAGNSNQSTNSIAIGSSAGQISQGITAIAIGDGAGEVSQSTGAIAIGANAGVSSQGQYSIAIGYNSGSTQAANSIEINATSVSLSPASTGLFIAPIRITPSATGVNLFINQSTNEVFAKTLTIPVIPAGRCSFQATVGLQTIASNTPTNVNFGTTNYNLGSIITATSTNSQFQNTSGNTVIVLVTYNIYWDSVNSYPALVRSAIEVNGSSTAQYGSDQEDFSISGSPLTTQGTYILTMASSDYFNIVVEQDSTGNAFLNDSANLCYVQIWQFA